MKKLRLEDLSVESFVAAEPQAYLGTVRGHDDPTADPGEHSCAGTCGETREGLCGGGNSVGLSACCYTNTCTQNPYDAACYDSYNYCVETALCPSAPMVCDTLTVCGGA